MPVGLKVKMAVLRFLSSEIFSANECLAHFIIAASDPKHRSVSDVVVVVVVVVVAVAAAAAT